MLQQALSDARTRVSESPFAKFSADGAIQADLRSSESAGAEPDMPRATAGSHFKCDTKSLVGVVPTVKEGTTRVTG